MRSSVDLEQIATELLGKSNLRLLSITPVQSLWAGYGGICRLSAVSTQSNQYQSQTATPQTRSLILKYVQPPVRVGTSKSYAPDEGHLRKVLSYQVEQHFYTHLAPQMPETIGLASCISTMDSWKGRANVTAMVLTDLRSSHPLAGEEEMEFSETQTHAALKWLADFHGFWWNKTDEIRRSDLVLPPLQHFAQRGSMILGGQDGVWLNGGYTYLATRSTEYAGLLVDPDSEWSSALCDAVGPGKPSIAELVAAFLAPVPQSSAANNPSTSSSQPYQTLLHGDIKSENLFINTDGNSVAFYDFQYVGLGLGVCDLAKFFTCSAPLGLLLEDVDCLHQVSELPMQPGEKVLLQKYLTQKCEQSGKKYEWEVFVRHWEAALVDWLRFQTSWGFWGNSDWLEARVRSILNDGSWLEWLKSTSDSVDLNLLV